MVKSRKLWIYEKTRHVQQYDPLPHPPGKEWVSGESLWYLGRNYRIELVEGVCEIRFEQKFMVPHTLADKSSAIRNWFIARAEEKILPRVALHAKNLGVEFKEAKVGHGSIVGVLVRQLTM